MSEAAAEPPKDIKFQSVVVDVACHPSKDYVAAGLIEGDIHLYSYSATESNHELMTFTHHKKSCRALRFSQSGDFLYTASKDKSIQVVDMEKGAVKQALKKAHKSPVYSLLVVDDNILASGDDDGVLKVWDLRQQKAVMESEEIQEFISDMGIDRSKRILVASSGEGTLSAFDIRKHKLRVQSELFDSEFLSLAIMKNEQKVVCGTGDGTINLFNWSEWGNISDRFPGHPMSVDCMAKLNEDVVFTGSIDGLIRAVHVLPNRFLGVVGQHEDFPVENLSLSHCESLLASCSHDSCVKFWDVTDVSSQKVSTKKKAKRMNKNKAIKKTGKGSDFFSDLAEPTEDKDDDSDDDDDDDDDSDEDSDDSDNDRPKKKLKSNSTPHVDSESGNGDGSEAVRDAQSGMPSSTTAPGQSATSDSDSSNISDLEDEGNPDELTSDDGLSDDSDADSSDESDAG